MERYPNLQIDKLSASKVKRNKITLLVILFLFMSFNGVTSSLPDSYSQIKEISELIYAPLLIAIALGWCMYDAMSKGIMLGFGWSFGIFLLSPLVVPAYFYKTYGAKTGTIKTIMAFVTVFMAVAVSALFSAITQTIINT